MSNRMNCSPERCQNSWSIINPCCFLCWATFNQPQMKFTCSINPSYANIWCYKCVQSDRCISITLGTISICMVMKPSKGIQQARWKMTSFHQHHYLHLVTSGIGQKKEKLIKKKKQKKTPVTVTHCYHYSTELFKTNFEHRTRTCHSQNMLLLNLLVGYPAQKDLIIYYFILTVTLILENFADLSSFML